MPVTDIETTRIKVTADNGNVFEHCLAPIQGYAGWLEHRVYVNGALLCAPVRFKCDSSRLSQQSLNVGGGDVPNYLVLNSDGELFDENKDA